MGLGENPATHCGVCFWSPVLFKLGVTSGTQGFAIMEIEMSKIAKVGILDVCLTGLVPLEVGVAIGRLWRLEV